jgi:hypothetical protein
MRIIQITDSQALPLRQTAPTPQRQAQQQTTGASAAPQAPAVILELSNTDPWLAMLVAGLDPYTVAARQQRQQKRPVNRSIGQSVD